MSVLAGKTILVLSQQAWGAMRISKHQYALELARQGSRVFFLNPPLPVEVPFLRSIAVEPCAEQEGLSIVTHRLGFPARLRAKAPRLARALTWLHLRALQRRLGAPIDVVWSYDLNHMYPLWLFPARALKLYQPMDESESAEAIATAKGADLIVSVTREILDKYSGFDVPKHLVNHGVSEALLRAVATDEPHEGTRVGMSGNFLRPDIDHDVVLEIVRANPRVVFECWGSYRPDDTNLGGEPNAATPRFVAALCAAPNVVMHGPVTPAVLAAGYRRMDAFLIAYDVVRDTSHGTNYHKVMEFLATGKVIVSNNVTAYAARPELVTMVAERTHNRALPALFREVLGALAAHNAPERQRARREYAAANSYPNQVAKIAEAMMKTGRLP